MTHITIKQFLETKHDGYEFEDKFFWSADECFDKVYEWVQDEWDYEDEELVITICKFSKPFSRQTAKDFLYWLTESLDVDFDDDDWDLYKYLQENRYGDEMLNKYQEFEVVLTSFLESLDNAIGVLQTTKETLLLNTKEVLNYSVSKSSTPLKQRIN